MGGALLRAWLAGDGFPPCIVQEPHPADWLSEAAKSGRAAVNVDGAKPADILVLAVKPQYMGDVLPLAAKWVDAGTVVVSVAAGSTIAQMAGGLGGHKKIVRVMPNTPALVGKGMSVLCAHGSVSAEERASVERLFEGVGNTAWLEDETLMDAVTAVSGSGPAYVFLLAEVMAAAGVKQGLPEDLAMQMAMTTIWGAGEMMGQGLDTPTQLRENVTSPGGTTAAALAVLMAEPGLRELLDKAIDAATKRGRELGA